MNNYWHYFILIPLVGFLLSLFIPEKKEHLISWVSFFTIGVHLVGGVVFVGYWLWAIHAPIHLGGMVLYESHEIEKHGIEHANHYIFLLDFYFDKVTAIYLLVGGFLVMLITLYCRYYLHREQGYKRFFNTLLFFYLGYTIIIFAGNFETLFIGWEMLGVSSFLLIAFYRDRYLPVRNAMKVFSVYRIGDVGLLLAMWMSHYLWHENITFLKLNQYELVHEHLELHNWVGASISFFILVTALAKSAQFPFSSWLPRAMEGPTPSSAIFYGSLSVHMGVFLLLRTFPFWENQYSIRVLIFLFGAFSAIIASPMARVQSAIKSQIAYESIAQIGLIFVELSFGFTNFALFHFIGNAFLRTYQLLVSPSSVIFKIREQFYHFEPRHHTVEDTFPKRLEYSIYQLSLKEWHLDSFIYSILWRPIKKMGNVLKLIETKALLYISIPIYLLGLYLVYHKAILPASISYFLPTLLGAIGFLMVLKSFGEREKIGATWGLILANHFWIALAIAFNKNFDFEEIHIYLSGIVVFGFLGLITIRRLQKIEIGLDLFQFHGHAYEHPKIALIFLIACLGVTGFPISPTFLGEDLIFSHIEASQFLLAFFVASSFILDGLAIIRIYSRIFLGPHIKTYHEVAYRSA